ncbi:MAG: DUF790 family protein [Magnetococcales bacterium]|nr:DUF790 family protein [Magnetococcales bacterium]
MLTKDLLRFDQRNNRVYPRFVDSQNRSWQAVAEALALVYASGSGYSREELTELTLPILNAARSPLVAKGLNKLLLDRCTFQETDAELEPFRMTVFTTAAQQLGPRVETGETTPEPTPQGTNNLEKFRHAVAQTLGMEPEALSARLYADLPARQCLLTFDPLSPEHLLHRYNMAQAQGPLWWARTLRVETDEPDVGVLRPFFRYIKWFQLLARITRPPAGGFAIQLDGPLSLFENSRKYGLLLANLLPAVCVLSHWRIRADVEMPVRAGSFSAADHGQRSGPAVLELDYTAGLHSHFTHTSAYVPEEFERFAILFSQEVSAWTIQEETALLELDKQEWTVPDFSFRHESGVVVHLELFHRWHAPQLQRRVQAMSHPKRGQFLLAVGVDRFLVKQAAIAAILQESEWYQQHGFAFNAFPPVKRVVDCLDGFLK